MRSCAAACGWLLLAASSAFAAGPRPGDAAPPLAPRDVAGRALAVPSPGHLMLLSFASRTSGEAAGEITRALRVAHPELEILSFIDLAGVPEFMRAFVTGQITKHLASAVEATRAAFTRAGKTAPADLDARVHLIPDWDAASCNRYGAGDERNQPVLVLIGAGGRVAAIATRAVSPAVLELALEKETGVRP